MVIGSVDATTQLFTAGSTGESVLLSVYEPLACYLQPFALTRVALTQCIQWQPSTLLGSGTILGCWYFILQNYNHRCIIAWRVYTYAQIKARV